MPAFTEEKNDRLISIIVPVYSTESYLPKCVDSILAQTYPHFELLLIDDGSPDNCPQLCDAYAEKDARIRVFHKPNGGLSSAKNYGLNQTKGAYILFVDSDDYIPENHLQVLIGETLQQNVDLVCGGIQFVPGPKVSAPRATYSTSQFMEKILYRDGVGDHSCSKLYHRKMFDGIRFTEGITSEDFEIFYRLFTRADIIVVTDETTYYYVQRAGSISNQKFNEGFLLRLEICDKLIERVTEDFPSILPAAHSRAVDEAIWLYGILPKGYDVQKRRIKAIVRRYGKAVQSDVKTTPKVKRKIRLFALNPAFWKMRMWLKNCLIRFYTRFKIGDNS